MKKLEFSRELPENSSPISAAAVQEMPTNKNQKLKIVRKVIVDRVIHPTLHNTHVTFSQLLVKSTDLFTSCLLPPFPPFAPYSHPKPDAMSVINYRSVAVLFSALL